MDMEYLAPMPTVQREMSVVIASRAGEGGGRVGAGVQGEGRRVGASGLDPPPPPPPWEAMQDGGSAWLCGQFADLQLLVEEVTAGEEVTWAVRGWGFGWVVLVSVGGSWGILMLKKVYTRVKRDVY